MEENHEHQKLFAIALLSGVMVSPAWALFETNKDLISTAKITMEEAVRAAAKAVPGGKVPSYWSILTTEAIPTTILVPGLCRARLYKSENGSSCRCCRPPHFN